MMLQLKKIQQSYKNSKNNQYFLQENYQNNKLLKIKKRNKYLNKYSIYLNQSNLTFQNFIRTKYLMTIFYINLKLIFVLLSSSNSIQTIYDLIFQNKN